MKVSRDAVFHEKETFNENEDDSSVISLAQPASSNEEAEEIQQSPTEVIDQAPVTVSNLTNSRSGRPQRERKAPAWIRSGDFDLSDSDAIEGIDALLSNVTPIGEPASFESALRSPDSEQSQSAQLVYRSYKIRISWLICSTFNARLKYVPVLTRIFSRRTSTVIH